MSMNEFIATYNPLWNLHDGVSMEKKRPEEEAKHSDCILSESRIKVHEFDSDRWGVQHQLLTRPPTKRGPLLQIMTGSCYLPSLIDSTYSTRP